MIAAAAVRPAHAGGTLTSFGGFSSHDSAVTDLGLPDFVTKVPISFVAEDRLRLELGANCRIDPKVLPGRVQDPLQIREFLIIRNDQWNTARSWSLLVCQQGGSILASCPLYLSG